ncbi:hypothetical protein NX722_17315 [Endozoicomonas gorgoniicola]|uniref:Uncharacterized protein n=1 Tax=Endozoicomonas gorgoniicola TaxID=1234144 RepID=A0ABT3MYB0_9GAMM|nr:hypothetical protein [Endozoicomonas gorgoniicola]MCW7554347.1 hypothetical protein [Endozoicomonas gorgoniicola]
MSSGITPGSSVRTPPITSTSGAAGSTGKRNGTSVAGVANPRRQLGSIPPNQTSGTSLRERSASQPGTPPSNQLTGSTSSQSAREGGAVENPREKQKREVEEARQSRESSSLEELEAEQEALLNEAGEKYQKVEEHTVLGKAFAALDNPSEALKGVKVIIRLPGEDKPIHLIPPDKKALKGRDVAALTKLAKDILQQYNNTVFTGFKKEEFNQRLSTIQEMLKDVGGKISEKGKPDNDWQKRLEDLQYRQSIFHVKEPAPVGSSEDAVPELTVERLGKEETEQLMKDLKMIEPEPTTLAGKFWRFLNHGRQP